MDDILARIVGATRRRLADSPADPDLHRRAEASAGSREPHRFRAALARAVRRPRLIAEIKAASPSAGPIAPDPDVEGIARAYRRGGAAAISVVAEPEFFRGSMEWIGRAADASGLPVLMKHFVVDERQILEGVAAGADGILLLASLLDADELRGMIATVESLGRDALVEVHDDEELERALSAGAAIVGVNNRNLRDFTVDLGTAERLSARMPGGIVRVAESGIRSADNAARMGRAGFDAVLVGEHLLRQGDREAAARDLAGPPAVKICGITRVEDARAAVEAGAAFIGLVFAEGSPRRVDVARAREIASAVRGSIALVGVFRAQDAETIDSIATRVGLDFAQVYGDARPTSVPVIRAFCVEDALPESGDAWLLYDGAAPGAGKAFDWALLEKRTPRRPFLLAGGLRSDTVGEAIVRVRPDGVDVSSGVEDAPGIKSAAKIREFIDEVQRA